MTVTIRIDGEVYERLKGDAEPFVDTPNSVLRRILGMEVAFGEDDEHLSVGPVSTGSHRRAGRQSGDEQSETGKQSAGRSKRSRASPDSILPASDYELPILLALDALGGTARPRLVVEKVGALLADKLTSVDKETLPSGGVRWQSQVQAARQRLLGQDFVDKSLPRGTWSLTPKGRERISLEGAIPDDTEAEGPARD